MAHLDLSSTTSSGHQVANDAKTGHDWKIKELRDFRENWLGTWILT
ncbi:hypothetical protein GGD55_000661 [Rhizobium giardinii]|uniref:Uncharacterized protein n=1 Tax=Rhizobium giardinii TaxID=56731 RepID=A0A7W8U9M5_9HYPH|nr:hypothetical protein [Rhizobium giardinii]